MKIKRKLNFSNVVVVVLLVAMVLVSVFFVHRMQVDVRQLVEIEEPLQQAILEMEINVGETARSVLHYVQDLEAHSLEVMTDSERDFERYAKQFERLAETDKERTLGLKVTEIYRDFKSLGLEITSLARRRSDDLKIFRKDVETIDALIDDKLQPAIDRSSAEALTKLEAALDMKINIDEAFAAIEGYMLEPFPEFSRKVADAEADFKRFEAQYRGTRLSADEAQWLSIIDKRFSEAVAAGNEIITLMDEIREKLDRFEADLAEIDRILDDEIQALILEETQRAAEEAQVSGEIALTVVLVAGLLVIVSTIIINGQVSRGIASGVTRLSDGATEFARGNLEHRIELQTNDELGGLAGQFNEMAERQKSDQASLRESEGRLRITLSSIGDAVIATDISNIITLMNPVAEQLTGWNMSEANGRPLTDVFHIVNAQTGKPARNPIDMVLESDKVVGLANHTMLIARDGAEYQIADSAAPIRNDAGDIAGVVLVFRDVTEQIRIEEVLIQSEKMLSVGGLAAGMAHEINNPLSGMMQTADVMNNRLSSKDMPANLQAAEAAGTSMEAIHAFMEDRGILRMVSAIQVSGERVAEIVANMLSFARRSDAISSSHDVAELLDKTLELAGTDYDLKKAYDFKTIEIVKNYEEGLPSVSCEGAKIQQVLLNILRNGAEAMQEAGIDKPTFTLRTWHETEGGWACIEIEDNGPGIDETTRKRIFEPFFTTKKVGSGTGLGLSVSYFIITENHAGEMSVESDPGKGARFIIRLPLNGAGDSS